MIQPQELRIDNLISDINGNLCLVKTIREDLIIAKHYGVGYCLGDKEQFNKVELTEEWLLRFGFEKAPLVDKYLKGYFTYDSKLKYFTYFTDIEDGGYENIIIQKEKLKYVHQLQNLYFALTGEELILKN